MLILPQTNQLTLFNRGIKLCHLDGNTVYPGLQIRASVRNRLRLRKEIP